MSESKRDLKERTFALGVRVVALCRTLDRRDSTCRILAGQLLRSGTSVGANIEEAQASQSRADFLSKCSIACKEARETHYWLRLLAASGAVGRREVAGLLDECDQVIAILTAIVKKVKQGAK
ncbi:MAG: four helix bundle protein [candidate division WOR-3 bacterium]